MINEHTKKEIQMSFMLDFCQPGSGLEDIPGTKIAEICEWWLGKFTSLDASRVEMVRSLEKEDGHEELFSHRNGYCKCTFNDGIRSVLTNVFNVEE